jgi:hypothetical protein
MLFTPLVYDWKVFWTLIVLAFFFLLKALFSLSVFVQDETSLPLLSLFSALFHPSIIITQSYWTTFNLSYRHHPLIHSCVAISSLDGTLVTQNLMQSWINVFLMEMRQTAIENIIGMEVVVGALWWVSAPLHLAHVKDMNLCNSNTVQRPLVGSCTHVWATQLVIIDHHDFLRFWKGWNHVSPWFESLFLFSNYNFGFVFLFINLFGYSYQVDIQKKKW